MSKTRPKPCWWQWKTYGRTSKNARRIQNKGQRRVRDAQAKREIEEQR